MACATVCSLARNPKTSVEALQTEVLDDLADAMDDWRTDLRYTIQAEFHRFAVPLLEKAKGADMATVIGVFGRVGGGARACHSS